ncbi:hypothetical protein FQR65_LT17321 [Abscondita terminalis]|nr:hypothetical protein FQR65_LT17321 [Abscondita terminalis]
MDLKPNHFKKDELQHELQIRGVDPGDFNVQDLRSMFSSLQRLQKEASVVIKDENNELLVIHTKLIEIQDVISSGTDSLKESKISTLKTRVLHYLYRSNAQSSSSETPLVTRNSLLTKILVLLDILNSKSPADAVNSSSILSGKMVEEGGQSDVGSDEDQVTYPPAANSTLVTTVEVRCKDFKTLLPQRFIDILSMKDITKINEVIRSGTVVYLVSRGSVGQTTNIEFIKESEE